MIVVLQVFLKNPAINIYKPVKRKIEIIMKKFKESYWPIKGSIYQSYLIQLSALLFLISITGCEDFVQEEMEFTDLASNETVVSWQEWVDQIDPQSEMIIVQNEGLIQEAVNEAPPGATIYIAPGIYYQTITINKPDIKLIGLINENGEAVILENPGNATRAINLTGNAHNVEIANIKFRSFIERDLDVLDQPYPGSRKYPNRIKMDREDLGGGIAHYEFEVTLGDHEFDIIRIHRVVRESRPYRPIKTVGDVFMIHGAIQDFEDIFLVAGAEVVNDQTSSPYYLAANDIDVWGIDMAWTRVPIETTDFTFMQGWGMERDIDHALRALSLARVIRGLTGQGFGKMNLLGFSYGLYVGYGAAGRETQMHPILQSVGGLIPVDSPLKYGQGEYEAWRDLDCADALDNKNSLDAGVYQSDWGVGFIGLAGLALNAPDEPSPVIPGLTNAQALIFIGSAPSSPEISWHFFGGSQGTLTYTDPLRFFRLGVGLSPYMPLQILYELSACSCDEEDVSFDDYVSEISVPIFYIGANGGTGEVGEFSATITASNDISSHVVSLGVDATVDFGHADLWMGYDANILVWEELRGWLVNHSAHVTF